jgi:ABC-type oligopeptide transport system substrate-binding subunit
MGIIIMMISGCTKKEAIPPSQLNIHFPPVSLNLDPHKMEDAFSMTVVLQIHRGLLRYTPSGDVAPDLAKKWSDSTDHKTYTFKLSDAHFSDGSPVTAKNVQMSFARLFYSGAAMGADLDYIDGAAEFKKTGDIEKLGIRESSPNEIVFHLGHPSALFLKHLAVADCAILPLTDFKQELAFDANTPYAGPYKVISVALPSGEFSLS